MVTKSKNKFNSQLQLKSSHNSCLQSKILSSKRKQQDNQSRQSLCKSQFNIEQQFLSLGQISKIDTIQKKQNSILSNQPSIIKSLIQSNKLTIQQMMEISQKTISQNKDLDEEYPIYDTPFKSISKFFIKQPFIRIIQIDVNLNNISLNEIIQYELKITNSELDIKSQGLIVEAYVGSSISTTHNEISQKLQITLIIEQFKETNAILFFSPFILDWTLQLQLQEQEIQSNVPSFCITPLLFLHYSEKFKELNDLNNELQFKKYQLLEFKIVNLEKTFQKFHQQFKTAQINSSQKVNHREELNLIGTVFSTDNSTEILKIIFTCFNICQNWDIDISLIQLDENYDSQKMEIIIESMSKIFQE